MASLLRTRILGRTRAGASMALMSLMLAACQTAPTSSTRSSAPVAPPPAQQSLPVETPLPPRAGFTCCNLHYEGDWISAANWGAQPFIAAGTPITLKGSDRNRLLVEINGRPMRIGLDYGKEQMTLSRYAERLIVSKDPKAQLAQWPAAVQQAIREGKVMVGMTKDQVIMAVGYPQADQTRSLNEPKWNYWASSFGQYVLLWDKAGKLSKVETDAGTYSKMVYRGQ